MVWVEQFGGEFHGTGELGVEGAGLDQHGADAEGFDLSGEGFGDALDCKFGGRVGADKRKRVLAYHRGEVDNEAGFLIPHEGKDRFGNAQEAENVDLVELFKFGFRGFLDRACQPETGVVHQNVDFSKLGDGLVDSGSDGGLVGDIDPGAEDAVLVVGAEVLNIGDVAAGGDDFVAVFEGFLGGEAAKSSGCSRDEPSLLSAHRRALLQ